MDYSVCVFSNMDKKYWKEKIIRSEVDMKKQIYMWGGDLKYKITFCWRVICSYIDHSMYVFTFVQWYYIDHSMFMVIFWEAYLNI